MKKLLMIFILYLASNSCFAMENVQGDSGQSELLTKPQQKIFIKDAWIRTTKGGMKVSAMYCTINNTGEDDFLIQVDTDIALNTDIHKTVVENDISKMVHIKKVAIPANQDTLFEPGGIHVMLMGVKEPLKSGDLVRFKFYFEKHGIIEQNVIVTDK